MPRVDDLRRASYAFRVQDKKRRGKWKRMKLELARARANVIVSLNEDDLDEIA